MGFPPDYLFPQTLIPVLPLALLGTMTLYEEEFRPKNFYDGLIDQGYGRATDCIACGQCEGVCSQHLPIIELLKNASAKLDA